MKKESERKSIMRDKYLQDLDEKQQAHKQQLVDQQREADEQLIRSKTDELMTLCRQEGMTSEEAQEVLSAFNLANKLHAGVRRKSGEPYIIHPIEVALITVRQFGFYKLLVICSLLHDVAEDTSFDVPQIKNFFGEQVAHIVDGVTKVDYEKAKSELRQSYMAIKNRLEKKLKEKKAQQVAEREKYNQMLTLSAEEQLDQSQEIKKQCGKVETLSRKIQEIEKELAENDINLSNIKQDVSAQAATYAKILKMMCNDTLIFYVKICDRLHNMRTLDSLDEDRQKIICSETSYLYAPIAYRFGLYNIKVELENLAMKYTNPEEYHDIEARIDADKETAEALKRDFLPQIHSILQAAGFKQDLDYTIANRTKKPFSCWRKMQTKGIKFTEIYDLYAMRIVLNVPESEEKERCEQVYQLIRQHYEEVEGRFRNWLDFPKANGYMSLHTTIKVPAPFNRNVEVQIRSERMDEIAENGDASHVLYKVIHPDAPVPNVDIITEWLRETLAILNDNKKPRELAVKEVIENTSFTRQVICYTPMGEEIKLPTNSTVLDFAFNVHSYLGFHCLGAKSNGKVIGLGQSLRNGETVEIIVSQNVQLKAEWLGMAYVPRTKEIIRDGLRKQHRRMGEPGKQKLVEIMKELHVLGENEDHLIPDKVGVLKRELHYRSDTDLYIDVYTGAIKELDVAHTFNKLTKDGNELVLLSNFRNVFDSNGNATQIEAREVKDNDGRTFLLDQAYDEYPVEAAVCCKPVPGETVVGIIKDDQILIHRSNCPVAQEEMANHRDRLIRCRWNKGKKLSLLTGVSFEAKDRPGLLKDITDVISGEMELNMRAITLETSKSIARGVIFLYVPNVSCLNGLIEKLQDTKGIKKIHRI